MTYSLSRFLSVQPLAANGGRWQRFRGKTHTKLAHDSSPGLFTDKNTDKMATADEARC
jgi:hypothetical protein